MRVLFKKQNKTNTQKNKQPNKKKVKQLTKPTRLKPPELIMRDQRRKIIFVLPIFIVSNIPITRRPPERTVCYRPLSSHPHGHTSSSQVWPQGSDKTWALKQCKHLTKPTEPRSWMSPGALLASPAPKGRDGRGCIFLGTALIERSACSLCGAGHRH